MRTVQFDAEKPEATTGKIVVEAKSLTVPNPMMKDHMHGAQWLDVAKFPEISFTAEKLAENFNVLIELVMKMKPATAKGVYLKGITVSSTMGPGIKIDPAHFVGGTEEA